MSLWTATHALQIALKFRIAGKGQVVVFLTVLFDATQLIPYLLVSGPLLRKVPRLPCEPRTAWEIQKGWKGIGICFWEPLDRPFPEAIRVVPDCPGQPIWQFSSRKRLRRPYRHDFTLC